MTKKSTEMNSIERVKSHEPHLNHLVDLLLTKVSSSLGLKVSGGFNETVGAVVPITKDFFSIFSSRKDPNRPCSPMNHLYS